MQRFQGYFEHMFAEADQNPGELLGMIEHSIGHLDVAFDVQGEGMKEVLVTRHVGRGHRFTRMIDVIFHVLLLDELRLRVRTAFLDLGKDLRLVFDLVPAEVVHAARHLHVTLVAMLVRVGARRLLRFDRGNHRSQTLLKQPIDRNTPPF